MITFYRGHLSVYGSHTYRKYIDGAIKPDDKHDVFRCLMHMKSLTFLWKIQSSALEESTQPYSYSNPLCHIDRDQIEACVNGFAEEHCYEGLNVNKTTLCLLDDMCSSFDAHFLSELHRNPSIFLREFTQRTFEQTSRQQ
jgi:hypothetical protein